MNKTGLRYSQHFRTLKYSHVNCNNNTNFINLLGKWVSEVQYCTFYIWGTLCQPPKIRQKNLFMKRNSSNATLDSIKPFNVICTSYLDPKKLGGEAMNLSRFMLYKHPYCLSVLWAKLVFVNKGCNICQCSVPAVSSYKRLIMKTTYNSDNTTTFNWHLSYLQ